jgi:hypothetical protein
VPSTSGARERSEESGTLPQRRHQRYEGRGGVVSVILGLDPGQDAHMGIQRRSQGPADESPGDASRLDGWASVAEEGAGRLKETEVDVGAAFVTGAGPSEGVPPGDAPLDHSALLFQAGAVDDARQQIRGVMPRVRSFGGRCRGRAATGNSSRGGRRGRPGPGGTAWTNGMRWVRSLRLSPVRLTASGMPPASQIKECLEPRRPRPTGGPT